MKIQKVYKPLIFTCVFLMSGGLLQAQCQAVLDTIVFQVVEQMPQYTGGYKGYEDYVLMRLKKEPIKLPFRDSVQVVFIIDKKGSVQNARLVGGANTEVEKESLRVVEQSPIWIPGRHKGLAVYVRTNLVLPIEKTKTD